MSGLPLPVWLYTVPSWILVLMSATSCSRAMPQVALYSIAAALATAWSFHGLWRHLRRPGGDGSRPKRIGTHRLWGSLALATLCILALAYLTGPRHDYPAYLSQWNVILAGSDPWTDTGNAYGMVHNLLAWTIPVDRLLPKLLFSALLVAAGAISAYAPLGINDTTCSDQRHALFGVFILSPFSLITVSIYANNDILPAAAMVVALVGVVTFRQSLIRFLSGGLLAMGCMSKFYPVIILPALSIRRRHVDWAFISGFVGTVALLTSLAYGLWGTSMIRPLLYAASRSSRHLSIFNFLRNVIGVDMDRFSLLLMLAAFVTVSWLLLKRNAGPVLGSILVFAATLSFYKLGQQQFFLFFFLVAPFAIRYLLSATEIFTPDVAIAFFAWIGFLNWYQLEYSLTCSMLNGPAVVFRYWGSLFYFLFSVVLAVTLLRKIAAR